MSLKNNILTVKKCRFRNEKQTDDIKYISKKPRDNFPINHSVKLSVWRKRKAS